MSAETEKVRHLFRGDKLDGYLEAAKCDTSGITGMDNQTKTKKEGSEE